MRYAYQRGGAPLLSWRGGTAPQGTRAADAKALGSLGGSSIGTGEAMYRAPKLELPVPGGPEPLGCSGCGPMGGVVDTITNLPLPAKVGLGIAAFFLYKKIRKGR
jgi:hypothetical protein